jgi:hypothetical protein
MSYPVADNESMLPIRGRSMSYLVADNAARIPVAAS